jgi:putative phosphoesterase
VLIAIVGDTHLSRDASRLPEACRSVLAAADLIMHAGDITEAAVLDELERLGPPVRAVHGNVDSPELQRRLPERLEVDLGLELGLGLGPGDVRIGMVHDAGRARKRLTRLREQFPGTRAVVFGHSHIPLHQVEAGFEIFNPGSPTDRRRQPIHTMGLVRATPGGGLSFEHLALD